MDISGSAWTNFRLGGVGSPAVRHLEKFPTHYSINYDMIPGNIWPHFFGWNSEWIRGTTYDTRFIYYGTVFWLGDVLYRENRTEVCVPLSSISRYDTIFCAFVCFRARIMTSTYDTVFLGKEAEIRLRLWDNTLQYLFMRPIFSFFFL